MSVMTEALERISIYCELSEPDRPREEIEKKLSFFPFQLSDEAYEFYQWAGAPVGMRWPDDDDCSYSSSTYYCALERFLGNADDLIHFLSLEEAKGYYSPSFHDPKYLPFVSYENGWLFIAGSETKVENSPVLQLEECDPSLWFPSLTNMMLAIAESLETVGTILPDFDYHNEDYRTNKYREKIQEQLQVVEAIAIKYGSPRGAILTN
ncbi:hypothetical protein IQ269_02280 [Tychonema sp. LEGE 07199]|uniref:hypothetical protein n=1 Tax=unclassified Tychonema TaxID=2642144 RepID=UPI00187EC892|nr:MULTISPECIES: hypothetical protein [unclassified Tychonema]MBE9119658.1 hypothetical protein [Tychonema sp. LEGE 07199]MBE9132213.1 hypothetical protein [Tychonema sp. LEGE 07196]